MLEEETSEEELRIFRTYVPNFDPFIVIDTPDLRISADANSAPLLTGEFSGADEMTDLGMSYKELDRLLKEEMDREELSRQTEDLIQFNLIRPKRLRNLQHS